MRTGAYWPAEEPLSDAAKAVMMVCLEKGDPIRMNRYYEAIAKAVLDTVRICPK